ncbi:MAG: AAA family ATPase [Candidatus Peribacteraceae bacterium]|nr:AAA family ATPase [Candidatus Peribacteraceae bacterium]
MTNHFWTEKYRPKTLSSIVGSPQNIKNIKEWANAFQGGKSPHFPGILFSGSAGIGKTSAAIAIAKDYDWDYVEFNASDVRTHDKILEEVLPIVTTQSLKGPLFRKLVVFDEADSFYTNTGREDKNASNAILKILKATKHPVVFTCNEQFKVPLDIQNMCVIVKFQKIREGTIRKTLLSILKSEGIALNISIVNDCIVKGDLRTSISNLQAASITGTSLPFHTPLAHTHFDLIEYIFRCEDISHLSTLTHEISMNPERLILWISENVTLYYKGLEIVRAFEQLSIADIYLAKARKTQDYSYWRLAVQHMTKGVALSRIRPITTDYRKVSYPSFLKTMSTSKNRRKTIWSKHGLASRLGILHHMSGHKFMEGSFPLLQKICIENPGKLLELKLRIDLNEYEIAYILDTTPQDPRVKRVLNPVLKLNDESKAIIKRQEEKAKPLLSFFQRK